jgi:predicted transcriptional regulator
MTGGLHTVRDEMTTAVAFIDRDASFRRIVRILQRRGVSALPVVRSDGEAVGSVAAPAGQMSRKISICAPIVFSRSARSS